MKIFCWNLYENYLKKECISFPNFSLELIKSGKNFDTKDLFKIKNTLIEGVYLHQKGFYFIEDCKKNGLSLEFYSDNNKEKISWIDEMKEIKHEGIFEDIFLNRNKYVECYYKNDNLNGKYIKWNVNGEKFIECSYKDDKYEGSYENWFFNGNVGTKCFYKDGLLEGNFIKWTYIYGKKDYECNYKNGKKDGKYIKWYYLKNLKEVKCFYKNGELNGEYIHYDLNGNKQKEFYIKGEKINMIKN
jgi:antitoxin component YwqK of YwqJK toxin-antitoxin module